jgi:membrane associated rhomboid family serine protease
MGRSTVLTLALFVAVFALQTLSGVVGGTWSFALALPISERPWTVVTSVYAHSGLPHLLANAVALVLVGPVVARVTTPIRFHGFFAGSGSVAGIAQVLLTAPFESTAVLGASGAIFALLGYALAGNRASAAVLARLPVGRRGRLAIFAVVAGGLTLVTAAPGVALVAHFVGFSIGAVAGRGRILHASRGRPTPRR